MFGFLRRKKRQGLPPEISLIAILGRIRELHMLTEGKLITYREAKEKLINAVLHKGLPLCGADGGAMSAEQGAAFIEDAVGKMTEDELIFAAMERWSMWNNV